MKKSSERIMKIHNKIILLFGVLIAFFIFLSAGINYTATLTNISEHNLTSTSGIAHLNVSDYNLKLYLAMDDNNSLRKVYDYTNNSNEGISYGNINYSLTSGYIGGAFNFDGANDYISVSDSSSLDFSNNFSFSMWVNLNESDQIQTILSKGNYEVRVGMDDKPYFDIISNDSLTNWTEVTQFLGFTNIYSLLAYNGSLYAGTGQSGGVNGQVFIYNETDDSWYDFGNLPGSGNPGSVVTLIVFEGKIYAGTYSGGKVFFYNETDNSWDAIGVASGNVLSMLVYEGTLYAGTNSGDELFIYNETADSWTNVSIIDGETQVLALAFYNGSLVIAPGKYVFLSDSIQSLTEIGNLTSEGVGQIRSFGVYNGILYLTTYGAASPGGRVYFYNETSDSWSTSGPLVIGSGGQTIFTSISYAGSLYAGRFNSEFHIYNETNDSWTNISTIDGEAPISFIQYRGKIYAGTGTSGKIYVSGNGSGVFSNTSIVKNSWTHLAGSFNGSELKIYLNGELVGTESFSGEILANNESLLIGTSKGNSWNAYGSSSREYFKGKLDEIMLFNKTLTAAEVVNIYNNASERFLQSGEMIFEQSLSETNTLDIHLENCKTPDSTSLSAKTSSGSFTTFSGCSISGYAISGNNVTIKLNSDSNRFFTPLILGDVVITEIAPASSSTSQSPSSITASRILKDRLVEGYFKSMRKGSRVEIDYGDSTLLIEATEINEKENKISFSVGEENYDIEANDSLKFDTDSDGFYDLEISVEEMRDNGYAYIGFREITEEVESEKEEIIDENIEVDEKKENGNNFWIYSLVVVLVLGIVFYSWKGRGIRLIRR